MLVGCSDDYLVTALKKGDKAAFDHVYERYSKLLFLFLHDKLKDPHLSSDVLQDIFISVWEKRDTLDITTSLKAYLYQSAKYKIIDLYRKDASLKKYLYQLGNHFEVVQPDIIERIHHRNKLDQVMQAINKLPLRMKEIFILSRFEHQSVKEIAQRLDLSPQTIKNQLSKALQHLKTNSFLFFIVFITIIKKF